MWVGRTEPRASARASAFSSLAISLPYKIQISSQKYTFINVALGDLLCTGTLYLLNKIFHTAIAII